MIKTYSLCNSCCRYVICKQWITKQAESVSIIRRSLAAAKRHPSVKILAWVKVNAAYVISLHVEIYSLRMIAQVQHHSHGSNISNMLLDWTKNSNIYSRRFIHHIRIQQPSECSCINTMKPRRSGSNWRGLARGSEYERLAFVWKRRCALRGHAPQQRHVRRR